MINIEGWKASENFWSTKTCALESRVCDTSGSDPWTRSESFPMRENRRRYCLVDVQHEGTYFDLMFETASTTRTAGIYRELANSNSRKHEGLNQFIPWGIDTVSCHVVSVYLSNLTSFLILVSVHWSAWSIWHWSCIHVKYGSSAYFTTNIPGKELGITSARFQPKYFVRIGGIVTSPMGPMDPMIME